jgi:hypothetical protein
MARLNVLLTGYEITDYLFKRTSSAALALDHDTIRGTADLEIWTGAGGTGTQLALTTDYTVSDEDTDLSTEAGISIYTKIAVINGTYHNVALYVSYKTIGDYDSVSSIEKIIADQYAFDAALIGFTGYSTSDKYLPEKIQIARSHAVGDLITSEPGNSPSAFAASRSTTNPTYPRYNPCIHRGDGDHDVTTTQVPQSVIDIFRAKDIVVGGYGGIACTVSGSVLTVIGPSNPIRDAYMAMLQNLGLVNRWKSSGESATYAASGPDWSYASRQYCVTILNVEYVISSISVGSNTITVVGTPPAGVNDFNIYPARIAGSTTSMRLRSLAGFVPIPAGDATLTVIPMAQLMDTFQGHRMTLYGQDITADSENPNVATLAFINPNTTKVYKTSGAPDVQMAVGSVRDFTTDGTNGPSRTSKNTSPRTIGTRMYTWLGVLNAVNWTTT